MKVVFTSIFITISYLLMGQLNMTLASNVDYQGNGNDIWGYVAPDGSEYAIVGTSIGTRVYSLEDSTNPIERLFVPGSNSTWRDMKQWGEYVYVTCDSGDDGLLILDMTGAPDNIEFNFLKPEVKTFSQEGPSTLFLDRCHNIFIDEKGIICLAGCQNRGVEFFDPKPNPTNPIYLGSTYLTRTGNEGVVDTVFEYAHDAYMKGDTLYASEIYLGNLTMYDVSDVKNPVILGSVETSSDFTHNAWADPTNTYAFTTDERSEGFVDAYDVSDPANIEFLDKFMPPGKAGTGTIPHNTHYFNGYLVTSWYTAGVVIVDGNKPDNLVQVAEYDTYDGPDGGFSGCWGVTPYLPSGRVIANDINSGLYVFDVTYQRACYLEGVVTDAATGASISNVVVTIISDDDTDPARTEANGEYKTGQATAGTYTVEYSHPLYESETAEVTLQNGEVTIQNMQLGQKPTFNISVVTIQDENGNPLENSQIFLRDGENSYSLTTDASGNASATVIAGQYDIYIGNWGYENVGLFSEDIQSAKSYTVELKQGYMDDFIVDLGWKVVDEQEDIPGAEFTGTWERAIPAQTFGNGQIYNPGEDAQGDLGNMAYVTANEVGGSSFSSDVDDGQTTLTSPSMDLTGYDNPEVQFRLWFATGSGNNEFDDEIRVYMNNGNEDVDLLVYNTNEQDWSDIFSFALADVIAITDNMTINFVIGDSDANGHITEGGVDNFFVTGAPLVNTEITEIDGISVYPSPALTEFVIDVENKNIVSYELIGMNGIVVKSGTNTSSKTTVSVVDLAAGSYFVRVITGDKNIGVYPLQVIK